MRIPFPRLRPSRLGLVLCVGLLALGAGWNAFAAADEISDLRQGVPTAEVVRDTITQLAAERDSLLTALNVAERDLTATLEARERFDEDQRLLASQIEAATDRLRRVAVRAFVSGGVVGEMELLVSVSDVSDLSWRHHLLENHAESSELAIERLRELEARAGEEVRESIAASERIRSEIESIEARIDELGPRIAEQRRLEPLAEAWDRAAIAIEEGSYGVVPADRWERLRFCESSDDYRAVSATGKFRGAYQFDLPTWRTVGGTGDPAAAPPAEQDARARELYARRGHAPWPQCGYHLR